jgi:hypothetical protein
MLLSDIYSRLGTVMEAKFHAMKGLEIARDLHSNGFLLCFYLLLANLELKCGNSDKVEEYYKHIDELRHKVCFGFSVSDTNVLLIVICIIRYLYHQERDAS